MMNSQILSVRERLGLPKGMGDFPAIATDSCGGDH
jgi:hypothetical protein